MTHISAALSHVNLILSKMGVAFLNAAPIFESIKTFQSRGKFKFDVFDVVAMALGVFFESS